MSSYVRAVCRLCRRSGDKLFLKGSKCFTKCTFEKRPKPPGPQSGQFRRMSDRGMQLREKQKARYIYGLMERDFRRFFLTAERMPGVTSDSLVVLMERRLDNVVFRLGFADSRSQARQLVNHGHILLSGRKTDVPSALVKEGSTISWREGSKKTVYFKTILAAIESKEIPTWLSLDRQNLVGKVLSIPTPKSTTPLFNGKSIVEYYSR